MLDVVHISDTKISDFFKAAIASCLSSQIYSLVERAFWNFMGMTRASTGSCE